MFFSTAIYPEARRHAYANAGQSLERFMREALHSHSNSQREPSAGVTQDEHSFSLSFDVPGIAKEHLAIAIEGAIIRISSKESAPRKYRATYELPQEIDPAHSEAKLEHGVLTLKLAKLVAVDKSSELVIQ
jgi:HSP20 family protein